MNIYESVGMLVVWGFAAALTALVVYLIPWRMAGYIYGSFRRARLAGARIPVWRLIIVGLQRWWWAFREGDGWFQTIAGRKVYLYGWVRVEEADE